MSTILTPISLWKDFDCGESIRSEVLGERREKGLIYTDMLLFGRTTEAGQVRIYGVEVRPEGEEKLPALLLLASASVSVDVALAERYAERGYCVFCMNYRGETEGRLSTVYPVDIDYANYDRAGRTLCHADEGAKKTAWYEWTAAARYAVAYLRALPYTLEVGALGIREGGDIVWKLMTFGGLDCGICVNAAGWLSARERNKYTEEEDHGGMNEEERLFVAGLDSQSYAPFVQCPVLMLVSVTDEYVDPSRAYDTYMRINDDVFSAIDYSAEYNGAIDELGIRDGDMFMDRFLKNREIFIPESPKISLSEGEDGVYAVVATDTLGQESDSVVCYAEANEDGGCEKEWRTVAPQSTQDNEYTFSLPSFIGGTAVFAFGKVVYSNGFTVSSKLAVQETGKQYSASELHTSIIYDSSVPAESVFTAAKQSDCALDCILRDPGDLVVAAEGYGKIIGAGCSHGLKTYRVSQGRFLPQEKSILHFDVYGEEDCEIVVTLTRTGKSGKEERYTDSFFVRGKAMWYNYVAEAGNLHSGNGSVLPSFLGCKELIVTEREGKPFLINNILWI